MSQNRTIDQLPGGGNLQGIDLLIIERSGINYKLLGSVFATASNISTLQTQIDALNIAVVPTIVPFTDLESNSSLSISHGKNRKVLVQVYDSTGNIRPGIEIDQSVSNTITLSVQNVEAGSVSGSIIFY